MRQFIQFIHAGASESGKTQVWNVRSITTGDSLGTIRWYSNWRQYCFFPDGGTVWSTGCLDDVQKFIVTVNNLKRKNVTNRNGGSS